MSVSLYNVLVEPVISEKASELGTSNCYAFRVSMEADKNVVKNAVETIYNVKVSDVNVMIVRGKRRLLVTKKGKSEIKKSNWKKALVKLMPGYSITLFEGV